MDQNSIEDMENLMKFIALSGAGNAPDSVTSELDRMTFRPTNLPKKTPEEEERHRRLVAENLRENQRKQRRKDQEALAKRRREEVREKRLSDLQTIWERDILPHWNEVRYENRVKALWREGIPPAVRGKVWMMALGNKGYITPELFKICTVKAQRVHQLLDRIVSMENAINDHKGEPDKKAEEELAKAKLELSQYEQPESKERSIAGIQYDLPRTFPDLGFFKKGGGFYEDLEQVLEAFVINRPDIGYVQGMSYIAGMLLLVMDKFKAFVCLSNIINNWMFLPFFRADEPQITRRLQLFKQILHYNSPALCEQFESEGVLPNTYLFEWVMTIFVKTLDLPMAYKVWDLFILEGELMVFRVSVALLKIIEKDVAQCSMDTILLAVKGMMQNVKDEARLVSEIDSVKMPDWVVDELPRLMQEFVPK